MRACRPFCVLGPAGSGKSTAVEVAIRRAKAFGALPAKSMAGKTFGFALRQAYGQSS